MTRVLLMVAIARLSFAQAALPAYTPPTSVDRFNWFVLSTVGPASLAGGLFSAGLGTLTNQPKEYGTHWDGFGKRYGMRLTGVSTGNAIEAGLGSLWGEDPRYYRTPQKPFRHRVWHVVRMTVVAKNEEGRLMPSYARYIGTAGNNYLSNAWRADSEATVGRAAFRTGLGFLLRMTGNAFDEFWPDAKARMFKHRGP